MFKKRIICAGMAVMLVLGGSLAVPDAARVDAVTQQADIQPTQVGDVQGIFPTPTINYPANPDGPDNNYTYTFKFTLDEASTVRITGLSRYTFWNYRGSTRYALVDAKASVKESWETYVNADHAWEEKAGNYCDKVFILNQGSYQLTVVTDLNENWRTQKYQDKSIRDYPLGFWMAINSSTYTGTPKLKSCKNKAKKKTQVKYSRVADAAGYSIQYSTKKNFKGAKTVKATKTSAILKSLKKKKTYYIRVRAYRTTEGKNYFGKWSNVKKLKIRK